MKYEWCGQVNIVLDDAVRTLSKGGREGGEGGKVGGSVGEGEGWVEGRGGRGKGMG